MVGEERGQPRLCTVRKWADFPGYGFNLHAERGRAGQYIGKVDQDSPAQAAGMKEGDRIVEVNGTNIGNENHGQVVARIKAAGEYVAMLLVDVDTDRYYKEQKLVISSDMDEVLRMETPPRPSEGDQETNDTIEEAEEPEPQQDDSEVDTVNSVEQENVEQENVEQEENVEQKNVEQEKEDDNEDDNKSDQENSESAENTELPENLESADNVESAENAELAEIDYDDTTHKNRLKEMINMRSHNIGLLEAYRRFFDNETPPPPPDSEPPAYDQEEQRETTPEPPEPEREPTPPPAVRDPSPVTVPIMSHDHHPRMCHVKKWPDFQGYGFNLHAEKEKSGQYIGAVDEGSPAEDAGMKSGDRIIEVNGVNIEDETHQQVIQRIKAGGNETKMLLVDSDADDFYKNNGIRIHSSLSEVKFMETREREAKEMTYHPRQCHLVKWPDFNGYGFNLHAEKERGAQFIGKVDADSPAAEAGLREQDRIIAVNGVNVENETHQQVIARVKAGGDETKLLVVDKEADAYYKNKGITVTTALPEVTFLQASRRSPRAGAPAVANGDTSSSPASQPMRTEPVKQPTAQANGGDFMNMSAKQMRELLAAKKKADPKHKSNLDFKTKYDLFQKM